MPAPSSVAIVIPSRYGSTRFPGKSLALLRGKPLIEWVWRAAKKSKLAGRVIVATDDERIMAAVRAFGGEAMMTRVAHPSGTDRMAEVASKIKARLLVNVQGDEPLITPGAIDALIKGAGNAPLATLAHRIESEEEYRRPDVVKVALNASGDALYFSRSPLPFLRQYDAKVPLWRHVGIYAYRADALAQFVKWKPALLEKAESLEQLRALENGMPIRVLPTKFRCLGVDTPEDLQRVEEELVARDGKKTLK